MQKKRKQQISESNLQVFGVTTEVDQGLQLFLKYLVALTGSHVWNNGEDELLCMTYHCPGI